MNGFILSKVILIMLVFSAALFALSLLVLVKSAEYSASHALKLARSSGFSEFMISFFIVAIISAFPEGAISIISALEGMPEFGMGTLIGSNVADLTLVIGLAALMSNNGIRIKSRILKKEMFYLFLLLLPIVLGSDSSFSRIDGAVLLISGVTFFLTLSREEGSLRSKVKSLRNSSARELLLLAGSLALLLASAQLTINSGVELANGFGVSPLLISLTLVSVGTCLPEMMFSMKAVRSGHDELALGDIWGTVITDATTLLGIVALIRPFSFDIGFLSMVGFGMLLAGTTALFFMESDRLLTKAEGLCLLLFYLLFLVAEFSPV